MVGKNDIAARLGANLGGGAAITPAGRLDRAVERERILALHSTSMSLSVGGASLSMPR